MLLDCLALSIALHIDLENEEKNIQILKHSSQISPNQLYRAEETQEQSMIRLNQKILCQIVETSC